MGACVPPAAKGEEKTNPESHFGKKVPSAALTLVDALCSSRAVEEGTLGSSLKIELLTLGCR